MYESKYDHMLNTDFDRYYQEIDSNRLKIIAKGKKLVNECPPEISLDTSPIPLKGIQIKEQDNLGIWTKRLFTSIIEVKVFHKNYPRLLGTMIDTGCTVSICKSNAFSDE